MLDFKVIEGKEIVGLELITLKEGIEKSKTENFYLKYQSKFPLESYGMLKGFRFDKKDGYYFIPVMRKGEILSNEHGVKP